MHHHPHYHTKLYIAFIMVLCIGMVGGFVLARGLSRQSLTRIHMVPTGTTCPGEVTICPDGTPVGRIPPTCMYAPCP